MNKEGSATPILVALVLGAAIGAIMYAQSAQPVAQDPNLGVYATESSAQIATSSTEQVGPQQVKTIFAANESCSNRVVSVTGVNTTVLVTFHSNITPTATIGYPITASSSAEFPASRFGCGAIKAFGVASTTISKAEYIR